MRRPRARCGRSARQLLGDEFEALDEAAVRAEDQLAVADVGQHLHARIVEQAVGPVLLQPRARRVAQLGVVAGEQIDEVERVVAPEGSTDGGKDHAFALLSIS